ncbi:hypothetical protein ANN_08288 [Periplaneta americana]|uniref:DUF4817 domain-containing protein n=1 Tax=Periplaneta americana TaxID=6978 RepID=A0ABQ8T2J5_PERAM|nr:hypothetical protein ANN_08288 [Periplaneta americana]
MRSFESSWEKKFSHKISASVWDRCPPSIVMHLGSYDRLAERKSVKHVQRRFCRNFNLQRHYPILNCMRIMALILTLHASYFMIKYSCHHVKLVDLKNWKNAAFKDTNFVMDLRALIYLTEQLESRRDIFNDDKITQSNAS